MPKCATSKAATWRLITRRAMRTAAAVIQPAEVTKPDGGVMWWVCTFLPGRLVDIPLMLPFNRSVCVKAQTWPRRNKSKQPQRLVYSVTLRFKSVQPTTMTCTRTFLTLRGIITPSQVKALNLCFVFIEFICTSCRAWKLLVGLLFDGWICIWPQRISDQTSRAIKVFSL